MFFCLLHRMKGLRKSFQARNTIPRSLPPKNILVLFLHTYVRHPHGCRYGTYYLVHTALVRFRVSAFARKGRSFGSYPCCERPERREPSYFHRDLIDCGTCWPTQLDRKFSFVVMEYKQEKEVLSCGCVDKKDLCGRKRGNRWNSHSRAFPVGSTLACTGQ